jgi:hypothetical protein
VPEPPEPEPPHPNPHPTPHPEKDWSAASLSQDCPGPVCPAQDGFAVDVLGHFAFGLEAGPPTSQGKLKSGDLAQLGAAAEAFLSQEHGSDHPTCIPFDVHPDTVGATVVLQLDDGTDLSVLVASRDKKTECFLGDQHLAEALGSVLTELATQYAGP